MEAKTPDRRLVPVAQPTALDGQTSIPLPGQELHNHYIMNVHVVPGKIDIGRFEAALSKALARYPTAAGRLIRENENWAINLTNSPAPVVVVNTDDNERPFTDGFAIQPMDIASKFANTEDAHEIFLKGKGDEPLVAFKLTVGPNWTAIGTAFTHTIGPSTPLVNYACPDYWSIGDAQVYLHFMVTLSNFYVNLDTPEDRLPMTPDFYRHTFPIPWSDPPVTTENFLPRLPHCTEDYDVMGIFKLYAEDIATTTECQFRLSSKSLLKIREAAKVGNEGIHISTQDAMTAYVTTALAQAYGTPITKVVNVVNYRASPKGDLAAAPKFAHPAAASNCVLHMYSDGVPEDQAHSVPAIARVIRTSIEEARQPAFIEKYQSFASWLQARAANTERYFYLQPRDEWQAICVNSNYKYDWNKAHFGYPGQATFHTSWCSKNFLRVFRANVVDEASEPHPADISFAIKKDAKDAYIAIVTRDYPDTIFQHIVENTRSDLEAFEFKK